MALVRIVFVVSGCVGFAGNALAAGFMLNDHGARATGRGVAVAATVTDGSAIHYNPAGLGFREGVHVYLGGTLIAPEVEFEPDVTGEPVQPDSGMTLTPNVYVAAKITDWLRVGLGFNTPFGSRISWPEQSPGRQIVREQILRTYFFSPVVALNLSEWVEGLSIGGGPDFAPATVRQARDVLFNGEVGQAVLEGSAFGFGGRAGIMYRAPFLSGLSIGASWRSKVRLNFTGDAEFDADPAFRPLLPPDGPIQTAITLPQSVLAGIAYRIIPNLEIEANVNWIGWGRFQQLEIELPDGTTEVQQRNYESTWVARAGIEYAIPTWGLAVRGGYAYDPTPIPRTTLDVTLPDINRHVVTLGASYSLPFNVQWAGFYVDLGLLYVIPGERETATGPEAPPLQGTFSLSAFVAALNLGVNFNIPQVP